MRDTEAMRQVFSENEIDFVIHFAGLKAVGESVEKPIKYYRNNIDTTLTLLEVMEEFGCKTWCSVHRRLSTVKMLLFHT